MTCVDIRAVRSQNYTGHWQVKLTIFYRWQDSGCLRSDCVDAEIHYRIWYSTWQMRRSSLGDSEQYETPRTLSMQCRTHSVYAGQSHGEFCEPYKNILIISIQQIYLYEIGLLFFSWTFLIDVLLLNGFICFSVMSYFAVNYFLLLRLSVDWWIRSRPERYTA